MFGKKKNVQINRGYTCREEVPAGPPPGFSSEEEYSAWLSQLMAQPGSHPSRGARDIVLGSSEGQPRHRGGGGKKL